MINSNNSKNYFWTASLLRPLFRRILIVFRPCVVDMRARNPDNFKIEYRVLLESVRFVII